MCVQHLCGREVFTFSVLFLEFLSAVGIGGKGEGGEGNSKDRLNYNQLDSTDGTFNAFRRKCIKVLYYEYGISTSINCNCIRNDGKEEEHEEG
jgi:hypothetical protein